METITKESVAQIVSNLVRYGIDTLELNNYDGIYAYNQLIDLFKIDDPCEIPESFNGELYADIINPLCEYALQEKMIEKYEVERFKTKFMGYVMPSPSAVIDMFDTVHAKSGIRNATTWLFNLSVNSAYINLPLINKNYKWSFPGKEGDLIININTARPEKDPKEIALAAKTTAKNYPKCMLCVENLGYVGRINHPARQNLRYIPIPLDDDSVWCMQFSPYRYFNEHCIFFNAKHEPMTLGEKSFARMVELLKNVPHYFIGSNAPLPIVGGSILAHDHYQGGAKEMPEFKARPKMQFVHPQFPDVKFSIVNWYNSVIRIKSRDQQQFVKAITYVNDCWAKYSDSSNDIIAHTTAQHNAITPVVRLERGEFYAELFLRNNRTDEAHPDGIFHPGTELHHIKKEGIGVIEVMGTFILPGRLASYIQQIRRYVAGVETYDEEQISNPEHPLYGFRKIIKLLMKTYNRETLAKADSSLLAYISQRCEDVLRATAVFKDTSEGFYGFIAFMKSMGMENADYKDNNNRRYQAQKKVEKDGNLSVENSQMMKSGRQELGVSEDNETHSVGDGNTQIDTPILVVGNDVNIDNVDNESSEEVKSEEIENVQTPKKRGRKPKAQTNTAEENATTVSDETNTADSSNVPAPKKRGRKPKADKENISNENVVNNETALNNVENDETQPQETSEEPTKRKRGRPKKNA